MERSSVVAGCWAWTFCDKMRTLDPLLVSSANMNRNHSENDLDELQIRLEPNLSSADFVEILKRSTLAERRPVNDAAAVAGMLRHADLIVTARTFNGLLIGVARSITDFHYCTYLSDLAVDVSFQGRGIGRRLIDFTHEQAGKKTTLILLAAPAAATYYPHIGLTRHDSCWIMKDSPSIDVST
jgi:ribosomal protein S18 acetylase RimI-like enzyme